MELVENIRRFLELVRLAKTIASSDISWDLKASLLFNGVLEHEFESTHIPIDFSSLRGVPSSSVPQFVEMIENKAKELRNIDLTEF